MRTAAQSVPSGDDAVVFLRQLDAPTPGEQERANAAFRRVCGRLGVALPRAEQTPLAVAPGPGICGCFWKSPVVGWDGTVTTCTRDNRLQNALGNVRDSPLSTIWGGGAMWAARQRVAMGDYSGKAACSGCFIPRSANYSGITVDEIASVAHASGWAS
jgi:radical SAM protein with 4Fe4S-binding SPASM domain